MEENEIKLLGKPFQKVNNLEELLVAGDVENSDSEIKIPQKVSEKLVQDEESLKVHLEDLKKENFKLQASIKAWQTTLEDKLDEFKNASLKLDEVYNRIWSERESFCSKTDEFNGTHGIISEWWETQLKFVSDLENLEKKNLENEKGKQEIEKLEKEVENLKKQINELKGTTQVAVVEVHASEDENVPVRRENVETKDKTPTEIAKKKKIRYSNEEQIEILKDDQPSTALYSMVSLETVRMVNRAKNRPH